MLSVVAVCFGDPHMTSLDGLAYTFNGAGEFWLLKHDLIQLQARFVPRGRGTVFGGVAASAPAAQTVNIMLSADNTSEL